MPSTHRSIPCHVGGVAAQRGVVLVIALIFLLLLTILAVGASNRSLLQERMAGGLLNAQRAQMSAQTALRGAEWKLWKSVTHVGTTFVCNPSVSCYVYDQATPVANAVNFRTQPGWITAGSAEYLGLGGTLDYTATANGELADNPRYIVEDMGPYVEGGPQHESGETGEGGAGSPTYEMYRITARATGGSQNTVVVLQSTFAMMQ